MGTNEAISSGLISNIEHQLSIKFMRFYYASTSVIFGKNSTDPISTLERVFRTLI